MGNYYDFKIKKVLDHELSTPPFFLINKQRSVPSWIGAFTTIIVYDLTILLYKENIYTVFKQTNPNILERNIETDKMDGKIEIKTLFAQMFRFSVKNIQEGNYLNESYFTPKLFLRVMNENLIFSEPLIIPIKRCPKSFTEYCIDIENFHSRNDTQILVTPTKTTILYLNLLANNNGTKVTDSIKEKLKNVYVSITFFSNQYNIYDYLELKKNESIPYVTYTEYCFSSINLKTILTFNYNIVKINKKTPLNNLLPLIYDPEIEYFYRSNGINNEYQYTMIQIKTIVSFWVFGKWIQ